MRARAWQVLIAGLAALLLAASAQAELTLMSAINKAGRQRMLSQRMVKLYCQVGLDVRTDEATTLLANSVRLFDAQLAELKGMARTSSLQEALVAVETRWKPLREVLTGPYARSGAQQLKEGNEALLAAAHRVVVMLEEQSGRNIGHLVNIAGRQRMLSQRIAKFYMLRELGLGDAEVTSGLEQAMREFKAAHVELRDAKENTPGIGKLIDKAGIEWELYEHSIRSDRPMLALFVALNSEKILRIMDEVTGLYERVGEGA
jgi:nitrate/nitrite-specific signal transduction histidine kinase